MNTNDLLITEDTNLVGLYLSQLAEDGRVLHVDAYEASPLRLPDGRVQVPFPASLVLVDGGGDTSRVRARLIAYHGATHDVLTMREARVAVPKEPDTQRLLTLNLFFTNQGNVVDAKPGAPVATGADLAETDLERFVSVCDGAPAPANRTAGEDGHCVDLDVLDLPVHDAKLAVPGSVATDLCYDLNRAFGDASVQSYPPSALVDDTSGTCSLLLPQTLDPLAFNVALATTGAGFPTLRGALRPLAFGKAFSVNGAVLTLPARLCALARGALVTSVLVSPRSPTWTGKVPVCAPWTGATTPDGGPDAGPDAASSSSGSLGVCGDGNVDAAREACDDGNVAAGDGCSDSCTVEPLYTCPPAGGACSGAVTDLEGTYSDFGTAVAMSSDGLTLAVGQPSDSSNGRGVGADPTPGNAANSGAIFVYGRADRDAPWGAPVYLKALNAKQEDRFGSVVALSNDGRVLVVGAPHESSSAMDVDPPFADTDNDAATGSGAAYTFERGAGGSWTQTHFLKAKDAASDDGFGGAVAVSGNGHAIVVGAPSAISDDLIGSGAAYSFDDDDGTWKARSILQAAHPIGSAVFGSSVATSEDGLTIAVGSPRESFGGSGIDPVASSTVSQSGAVDVYVRAGQDWEHATYLKSSAPAPAALFGSTVSLSGAGTRLAVGAPGVNAGRGAVFTFSAAAGTWAQDTPVVQASNAAADDQFGGAVALSADGRALLVGAVGEGSGAAGLDGNQADDSLTGAGAAYLFRLDATYTQRSYLKALVPVAGQHFGYAVSIDRTGGVAAVGGFGVPRVTVFGH